MGSFSSLFRENTPGSALHSGNPILLRLHSWTFGSGRGRRAVSVALFLIVLAFCILTNLDFLESIRECFYAQSQGGQDPLITQPSRDIKDFNQLNESERLNTPVLATSSYKFKIPFPEGWEGGSLIRTARERIKTVKAEGEVRKRGPRVAVCAVGGSRDFEITGPSILRVLLPAYGDADLFLHAPMDENSHKFWIANGAVNLVAVRIFPNTWVDEGKFSKTILKDKTSPNGNQGMFQYFRLIEGCIPLIRGHEKAHGFEYDWILRIRVDSFWAGPPPPLSSLSPSAYTIPYGTDCGGINDRGGIGPWNTSTPALQRVSLLHLMSSKNLKRLNSHRAVLQQMRLTNTTVERADFSFCIVTRRIYRKREMIIASMNSTAPLNGAKCRPCIPLYQGREARAVYKTFPKGSWIHRDGTGVDLCNEKVPWEKGWEDVFDDQMGAPLALDRQLTVSTSRQECVQRFREMKERAEIWESPSPEAICLRWHLRSGYRLGTIGHSYDTFLDPFSNHSLVVSTSVGKNDSREWEEDFLKSATGPRFVASHLSAIPSEPIAILKLALEGRDLPALHRWAEQQEAPSPICLLLVSIPKDSIDGKVYTRNDVVLALEPLFFQLSSCIREKAAEFERCTFFSLKHCETFV